MPGEAIVNHKEAGISGKRPSEAVYPADILCDAQLRQCSLLARGAWFEALLSMWRDGTDRVNGTAGSLARLWGCSEVEVTSVIQEFLLHKPCEVIISNENITLVCRRLARRKKERDSTAKRVREWREKQKSNEEGNDGVTEKKVLPSSSSSLSSSLSSSISEDTTPTPSRKKRHHNMSETEKRRTRVKENTAAMVRIGSWFSRKPTTRWNLYEAEALAAVEPTDEDLAIMEPFYTAQLAKDNDFRRLNVETLLNNWSTEMDKAHGYKRLAKRKHENI